MDDLIELVKKGNKEAEEKLYLTYKPLIYNYLYKRTKNKIQAEDLTSMVFIKVLEKIDQYEHQSEQNKFSHWLIRIAHNTMVDSWRKDARLTTWSDFPEGCLGESNSAEDDGIFNIMQENFKDYLTPLTDAQAEVIKYKFIDDMSNEQIAEKLGTSVGAIKSMQHRAFDAIREYIAA